MSVKSVTGVFAGALFGLAMLPGLASAEPTAAAAPAGARADVCASKVANSGYVHTYSGTGCDGKPICSMLGNDSDYGNSKGCSGKDDNSASSLLNNGTAAGGNDTSVRFYRLAGYGGGSICLGYHQYASNLANWTFTNGTNADNRISSHKWVPSC
ncbi:hypothetical protein [Amycolatopsis jiangsuensis]|uniref:Peptidase inhibitor family I36 n=1 Tax=Amycolatopsis jiangsuensis TaxID=1181879 RepID=A0A840IZL0_9PSEU|nr:hypothetical protein [Amycolatopsis jiangsuensis]MBB4687113.1 hypothetical protein [Amycolatopsis jiangsuensis]